MGAFNFLRAVTAFDRLGFAVPAHQLSEDRRAALSEAYAFEERDVVHHSKSEDMPSLPARAVICRPRDRTDASSKRGLDALLEGVRDVLGVSNDAPEGQLVGAGFCDVERVPIFFAARATSSEEVLVAWGRNADSTEEQARFHDALKAYVLALARVTSITGKRFKLCLGAAGTIQPEDDAHDQLIRIYPNARPPGEWKDRTIKTLYGLPIALNEPELVFRGAAVGRGVVCKDKDGHETVQVLGRHVFTLVTLLMHFNRFTSVPIFNRLIAQALEVMSSGPAVPAPDQTDEEALAGLTWFEEWPKHLRDTMQLQRNEIERLQRYLADATRCLLENETAHALISAEGFVAKTRERMPEELRRLRALDGVASVAVIDNGIVVTTDDIVIAWEERRFLIGPLKVRLGQGGKVTVWSEAPRHPDGIPHPHVDDLHRPCFGNAGGRIAKLLGEMRYADALNMVLYSIRRGYAHKLAARKIEEWPELDEEGKPIPVEVLEIADIPPIAQIGEPAMPLSARKEDSHV